MMSSSHPPNTQRLPDFIVIGAQKSASSFLQVCLTEHPDIWMPLGETPYFESPDYEQQTSDDLAATFSGRAELALGIKRPNYIGAPEVPARITSDCPDARLIAVLRNPIDRLISAFFHQIKSGFLPPLDPESGIRSLLDHALTKRYPRSAELLEFGLYHKHLAGYAHFRRHDRLRVMLHEDILSNPLTQVQQTYTFLGVDDTFVPERSIHSRPQAVIYHPLRVRLSSHRPHLLYRFNADRTRMTGRRRNPLTRALAAGLVATDRFLLARVLHNRKPKISDDLRHELWRYYEPDVLALSEYLGRDLSRWRPARG